MELDWLSVSLMIALAIHLAMVAMLVRNTHWLSWPAETRPEPKRSTSITVVVPARNEEQDIESCLRSLLGQDVERLQVIVVNDHSTDATPEIIEQVQGEFPTLVTIHDPPLRDGWLGKHNAMQCGVDAAECEYLLLTDADVRFQANCLSTAIAEMDARGLDLLSLYPRFQFHSFAEVILLPIYVGGCALLLSPEIENPRFQHAMAVGAFMLTRTETLRELGGLHPIHNEILDDVMLARQFKQAGKRISLRSAPDLMQIRFFKDSKHALFGFAKHIVGSVQAAPWAAILLAFLPLMIYGGLIASLVYGLLSERWEVTGLSAIILSLHYLSILYTRSSNEFNWFKALAFPCVSVPFAVSCLWAAYQLIAHRRFYWRGRNSKVLAKD